MVLVVEDNDDIRLAMCKLIRLDGYEAEGASSGRAAMAFLGHRKPHCIVLDVSMPEMDGFEVLRQVRADDRLRGVRVIMYSAHDGEIRRRAFALGADDFIQKGSLDWAQVQRVMGQHCGPPTAGAHPPELLRKARVRDVG